MARFFSRSYSYGCTYWTGIQNDERRTSVSSLHNDLATWAARARAGDAHQEVGGVMVTLAALCLANELDVLEAAETELQRIWTKVEAIRAKQAAKPKNSPLPGYAVTIASLR
jgi:hypothetical protein